MNKEEAPDRANRGFFMRQSFGGDRGSVRGGCRTCGQNAKSRTRFPDMGADAALSEALSKPRNSFPPPRPRPLHAHPPTRESSAQRLDSRCVQKKELCRLGFVWLPTRKRQNYLPLRKRRGNHAVLGSSVSDRRPRR